MAVCAPTVYELTHSARGKTDAATLADQLGSFDHLPCGDEEFARALEVQRLALDAGFHRALSLSDLLITAVAERRSVPLLHYDGDFDMIADLTGQSTRWVAPACTIP